MKISTTLLLCLSLSPLAAGADPKDKITYDQHVLPILRDKCLGCHNADKAKGGLDMTTYSKLMEGGSSGEIVKGGDVDGSRLFALSSHKAEPKMPPNSPPLAKESLDVLAGWIRGGLLENSGSKAVAAKPTADVSLVSVKRGRPAGPPPMPQAKLSLDTTKAAARANAVVALAVSPWAPLVAVGGPKDVLLYHGETMNLIGVLPFKYGMPQVLKFSRNGSLLLAGGGRGGHSGKVVVWSVKTGEPIIEVGNENDAVLAADISADQTQIALGGPGKIIRIYSTKDGSLVNEIKKHTDWIYAIEFSPDGVLLATGDRSGGLFVWESATAKEFLNLRGHTAAIKDLSWRDDSNVLASASEDGTIRIWEMENGTQIKQIGAHAGGVQSVKYGHDNQLVSTGRDKFARLWNANGDGVKTFKPLDDVGLRVGVSHDNLYAYTGDWTGKVRAFRIADEVVLGIADNNPAPFAQRLAAVEKIKNEKLALAQQAKAAFEAADKALRDLQTEVGSMQKNLTAAQADLKNLEAAFANFKGALDKANGEFQNAQNSLKAKDVKARILAEAAGKFKVEADAAKENPELIALANQARQQAEQAGVELQAARMAIEEKQALVAQTNAKLQESQKALAKTKETVQGLTQALPGKQQALPVAEKAVPPAKQRWDAAEGELKLISVQWDTLKAQAIK